MTAMTRVCTVACLVGTIACSEDEPAPGTPPDQNTTVDTEQTADTGAPALDLVGKVGSIVLTHWPVDAIYDEEDTYYAAAMFTDEDRGIHNLAQCVLAYLPCVDTLPDEGATITPEVDTAWVDMARLYDVGTLKLDHNVVFPTPGEQPYYSQTIEGFGEGGTLSLDGDFAAFSGEAVFDNVAPLELTAPAILERQAVGPGEQLALSWVPGDGEIWITLDGQVTRVADDGTHAIDIDATGLRAPVDTRTVIIGRTHHTEIDAAGNLLRLLTVSEQWLYLDYEDFTGWQAAEIGTHVAEDCAGAEVLPSLATGRYHGDLDEFGNDLDLGENNPLTGYAAGGNDAVARIDLTAGQTLNLTFRQAGGDATLYLLPSSCREADALAGADDTFYNEDEVLTWRASEDQTVFAVLDGWGEGGVRYALDLSIGS